MISTTSIHYALNQHAKIFCDDNDVSQSYGGFSVTGEAFEPIAEEDYINFSLIGVQKQRFSVKGNESDICKNAIYQATIYVSKSKNQNSAIRASELTDLLQAHFYQNLVLSSDGQCVKISRCNDDITASNDTHYISIVSIYFSCIN